MREEYRTRLEQYLSSMVQAKQMLAKGIITEDDFSRIEAFIARKYGLEFHNLYRGIDLLYKVDRVSMSHNKEVTSCPK